MDKLPPEAFEAGAALQWPIEKMALVGAIASHVIWLGLYLRDARARMIISK